MVINFYEIKNDKITNEIQEWLEENIKSTVSWFVFCYPITEFGTLGHIGWFKPYKIISHPLMEGIAFKRKSDHIAFKLRWE